MSLDEKLEFFQMLVDIGFKEIEVGFPAASETEFIFMRTLIERDMIPDDVTVQVLTQAREHIIKKTFEAVKGAPHAVIHLYNSTSVAQREQVFKKSKEQIMQLAVDGAELLKNWQTRQRGISLSSIVLKVSMAQKWIMQWKYVMQYLMYGSQLHRTRRSSTFRLL